MPATTTLSTKGQVIVPAETRRRLGWQTGTRLIVEDTPDGVLLKSAPLATPLFAASRIEDVYGRLRHAGPPIGLEEMDAAIVAEAKRQDERG